MNGVTMKVQTAYLHDQGISFLVFNADARAKNNQAREQLLVELTNVANQCGLRANKAALCYSEGARVHYFGTSDLVKYLSKRGVPRWTHSIDA
jgi:hypothetical protein